MAAQNPYVPAGAGAVIEDTVVEARMPWSGRVARGEHLVLVDLEGQQAIDFLCFNADDPEERYHAPNTMKLQGNIYLGEGSVLWSVRARKMMTVVEDTCGGHDTIFGCCSFELDDVRYGARNPRACQQNFESELARHGLGPTAVVPNINFFMRVPVEAAGSVAIDDGWSKPGGPRHPPRGDGCARGHLQLPGGPQPRNRRGRTNPDPRHPLPPLTHGRPRRSSVTVAATTVRASQQRCQIQFRTPGPGKKGRRSSVSWPWARASSLVRAPSCHPMIFRPLPYASPRHRKRDAARLASEKRMDIARRRNRVLLPPLPPRPTASSPTRG